MRLTLSVLASLCIGSTLAAQSGSAPTTLTLEEARALALRNNPSLLQATAARRSAASSLRAARGALLPSLSAGVTSQYTQGGQQFFQGASLGAASDIVQSQYGFNLSYEINRARLMGPRVQRANAMAIEADIAGTQEQLRGSVAQLYFNVLEAEARVVLQDTLVAAAQFELDLAKALEKAGVKTGMDVQRAEVALATAKVAQLQARHQVDINKVRLFEAIGVPQPSDVKLTTQYPVTKAPFSLDSLLSLAQHQNPELNALRAREDVSKLDVRRAKAEYTPSLSFSTGLGGYWAQYTNPDFLVRQGAAGFAAQRQQCIRTEEVRATIGLENNLAACQALVFTDAMAEAMRRENNKFPFGFTSSPHSLTMSINMPLFDGWSRRERVQQAQVTQANSEYLRRTRELRLTADVTAAYLTLTNAEQTIALQEQTVAKAREELKFAQDRYAAGQVSYLDVSQALAAFERAESDRINAIYEYHKAFAVLESAVGRPLR
jgi:outer membrane protein